MAQKMLVSEVNFKDVFEFNDELSIDVEREKELRVQLKEAMANPISLV